MKTFEDLKFEPWCRMGKRAEVHYPKIYADAKHAILNFPNGYGVSVLFGDVFYSNGIDSYEVGILKDGVLCYSTPITDDVIGYVSKEGVTRIMKQVQEL